MEKSEYSYEDLIDIVQNLNSKYYLTDLWAAKDAFLDLPKEKWDPISIIPGLVLIKVMEGKYDEAHEYLELIPHDVNAKKSYKYTYNNTGIAIPDSNNEVFHDYIFELGVLHKRVTCFTFTIGRPSVINGFRDFSPFCSVMNNYKNLFLQVLNILYGRLALPMFDIAEAEYLYLKNECMSSLLSIVSQIPVLEKKGDFRLLFVALSLQMKLLLANGEIDSAEKMIVQIKKRMGKEGNNELFYNIKAMETKFNLYEGKIDKVESWVENDGPDEFTNFNMLDLYRYQVKMRYYVLKEKFMAGISLSEKLRPILQKSQRYMDLCEIDLLLAMGGYKANMEDKCFDCLERALEYIQKYNYLRLAGDEGEPMLKTLNLYKKKRPDTKYLPLVNEIIEICRKTAVLYPNYLKTPFTKEVNLTIYEIEILNLLSQGLTYDAIATQSNISINTVRYHIKKIYEKLEVNSAQEAVARAKSLNKL